MLQQMVHTKRTEKYIPKPTPKRLSDRQVLCCGTPVWRAILPISYIAKETFRVVLVFHPISLVVIDCRGLARPLEIRKNTDVLMIECCTSLSPPQVRMKLLYLKIPNRHQCVSIAAQASVFPSKRGAIQTVRFGPKFDEVKHRFDQRGQLGVALDHLGVREC